MKLTVNQIMLLLDIYRGTNCNTSKGTFQLDMEVLGGYKLIAYNAMSKDAECTLIGISVVEGMKEYILTIKL